VTIILVLLGITLKSITTWLVAVGAVMAALVVIFKYIKQIGENIKGIFQLFNGSKSKNFKTHKLFENIEDTLREDKLNTSCSTRNQIALKLKDIKLNCYKLNIEKFIQLNLKKISQDEIIKKAKDLLVDSMEESNKLFKKESNNKEEENTADLIINKYKYFEARQIENALEIINEYKYEKVKYKELINSILSTYQYIIMDIVNNTKETITKINGDLTGLYFMGKEIEPHSDKI
jgi:hypothetical protein